MYWPGSPGAAATDGAAAGAMVGDTEPICNLRHAQHLTPEVCQSDAVIHPLQRSFILHFLGVPYG